MKALIKKDLYIYLTSPSYYIFIALVSLVTGWTLFSQAVSYLGTLTMSNGSNAGELLFVNSVVIQVFSSLNLLFLLLTPFIVMGSFSDESKAGTLDLLYCSALSDWQIVIAKFISQFLMLKFTLVGTIIFPIFLLSTNLTDYLFIFTGYLGVVFNILCYITIGLFVSALFKKNMISGFVSLVLSSLGWISAWGIGISENQIIDGTLKHLSFVTHFESVLKGLIRFETFVFYFTLCFVFLFLCKKSLEARQW